VILICLISAAGSQSGTSIAFGIIFTLAALGVHGLAKYE
jgi:hypothetical protein